MAIDTKELQRIRKIAAGADETGEVIIEADVLVGIIDEIEIERDRADCLQAELDELKRIEKD